MENLSPLLRPVPQHVRRAFQAFVTIILAVLLMLTVAMTQSEDASARGRKGGEPAVTATTTATVTPTATATESPGTCIPIPRRGGTICVQWPTGAGIADDNLVAFRVRVNGYRVWSAHTNARRWEEADIALPVEPGGVAAIEFRTEALGDHRYTWAAWAQPRVIGAATV